MIGDEAKTHNPLSDNFTFYTPFFIADRLERRTVVQEVSGSTPTAVPTLVVVLK